MKTKLKRYKKLIYSLRWSVEIEASFPEKMDKDFFYNQYKKFFKGWTVTTDTTIQPEGLEFKPKDSNKLFYNKGGFEQIKDVLSIIKSRKGIINSTCGSHCHINASKFSETEIFKIVKELVARGEYISKDLNVSFDRLSETCRLITKKDIKGLTSELIIKLRENEEFDSDCPLLNSKYYILNLLNLKHYNTLEFRLFNGTLSLKEIKKNLKYLFDFLILALERE